MSIDRSRRRNQSKQSVEKFCYDCHDAGTKKGDLSLEELDKTHFAAAPAEWENVVRKLNHRLMPPIGEERPDEATYNTIVSLLSTALDRAAAEKPNPGRTDTFRRLTRTEYQNAVRDLLGIEIDATALLPK